MYYNASFFCKRSTHSDQHHSRVIQSHQVMQSKCTTDEIPVIEFCLKPNVKQKYLNKSHKIVGKHF